MKLSKSIKWSLPPLGLALAVAGICWHHFDDPQFLFWEQKKLQSVTTEASDSHPDLADRFKSKAQAGTKASVQEFHEKLSPDQARKLIEDFYLKTNDIKQRSIYCSGIIGKLCRGGNSKEAWELIDKGFGQVRSSELGTFFCLADLPQDELLGRLPGIEFKTDLSSCFSGYLSRFKPEQLEGLLNSSEVNTLLKDLGPNASALNISSAVSSSLQISLSEAALGSSLDILETAARLTTGGFLDPNDLLIAANSNKSIGSFDKWNILKAIDTSEWRTDARNKRSAILTDMVRSDAPKAIAQVLETSGDQEFLDLGTALGEWTNIDSTGAARWYTNNQAKLSQQERNGVASAFSTQAMSSLEFDGALQWAEQIQDIELKAKTLKRIEEKMAEFQTTQVQR